MNALGIEPQVFAWNEAGWRSLTADLERLPHALLLAGPPGLGKYAFAARLAQTLLCAQPGADAAPCLACKSCALFAAGTHPDLHVVTLLEDKKSILVDQMRELAGFVAGRPHTAARKVIVISPADLMNVNAANALLKILEEPPSGTFLVLVSAKTSALPATVRSRCARIGFHPPAIEAGRSWLSTQQSLPAEEAADLLALADNAPLRAQALGEAGFLARRDALLADIEAIAAGDADPVGCASRWHKQGAAQALEWLQGLGADLIRLKMGENPPRLFNPGARARLQGRVERLHSEKLFAFFGVVSRNRQLAGESFDPLLLLEDTLIAWAQLNRR